MMQLIQEIIVDSLMVVGAIFSLLAAVGIVRMPDLYLRMHSSTKAGTLGVGCLLGACAAHFGEIWVVLQTLLVVGFLFLTAPIASHLIARAAYFERVSLWKGTRDNELERAYRSEGAEKAAAREAELERHARGEWSDAKAEMDAKPGD